MTDFFAGRRTYYCEAIDIDTGYDPNTSNRMLEPTDTHPANLVSSLLAGPGNPVHKPCLDVDIPCLQVMSSTPGHSHLYFDVELTWQQYFRLITVLGECGIADPKWVQHSFDKQQTTLRPPGVHKIGYEETRLIRKINHSG